MAGQRSCVVGAINWVSIAPLQQPLELEVQVRYRSEPVAAQLTPIPHTPEDEARQRPHRCRLQFLDDQFSITPGQAAVFYNEESVLGGGLIQRDDQAQTNRE